MPVKEQAGACSTLKMSPSEGSKRDSSDLTVGPTEDHDARGVNATVECRAGWEPTLDMEEVKPAFGVGMNGRIAAGIGRPASNMERPAPCRRGRGPAPNVATSELPGRQLEPPRRNFAAAKDNEIGGR